MKRTVLSIVLLALGIGTACAADSASGNGALALAALVGLQSPHVSAAEKHALALMLDGKLGFALNGKIKVAANSVSCRSSNVDISEHDCTLKFGGSTRTLNGRAAHEIYATLVENGVASDGAAGSIYEALSNLVCTVDAAQVKQRGGGGADCTYKAGPGS